MNFKLALILLLVTKIDSLLSLSGSTYTILNEVALSNSFSHYKTQISNFKTSCLIQCEKEANCLLVSYNQLSKVCYFYSQTFQSFSNDLVGSSFNKLFDKKMSLTYQQGGCFADRHCEKSLGLVCNGFPLSNSCNCPTPSYNSMCDCPSDKYWNGTSCVLRVGYNGQCSYFYQCTSGFMCNMNKCDCDPDKYWNGGGCVNRLGFNQICTSSNQCSTNLTCDVGKCSLLGPCASGWTYYAVNKKCYLNVDGVTNGNAATICSTTQPQSTQASIISADHLNFLTSYIIFSTWAYVSSVQSSLSCPLPSSGQCYSLLGTSCTTHSCSCSVTHTVLCEY